MILYNRLNVECYFLGGFMKRNGMCPVCYAKMIISKKDRKNIPVLYNTSQYNNGLALTPPMGWSSWNTFQEKINQDMVIGMAKVMQDKGLVSAGYTYLNIDDCWEAKDRTIQGELQGDFRTFSRGMEDLVKKINSYGMKAGIYSSNGHLTCACFPASLGHEYQDAYTFSKWGFEYWKVDFCHHVDYPKYGPLVAAISYAKAGEEPDRIIGCKEGIVSGNAKIFKSHMLHKYNRKEQVSKYHVSGLDANGGAIEFIIIAEETNEYILTVYTHEITKLHKYALVYVNNDVAYPIDIPANVGWAEYWTQISVQLVAGKNTIKIFNPIINRATSDMLQYQYIGKCIKQATADYAKDSGKPEKKIMFSLCEWGAGKPYLWGKSAGNLWRTTGDITYTFKSICNIYEHNVELYEYAGIGGWNDPDMLEVGVGELTYNENEAHFALWCMMAAPLILGNDVRKMSDEILKLVTNKHLIAINQDVLGKQAKRIVKGNVDILVKPLNKGTAVCIFNKSGQEETYILPDLKAEKYINFIPKKEAFDALIGKIVLSDGIKTGIIKPHSAKVFII